MKGSIELTSALGKGSEPHITLNLDKRTLLAEDNDLNWEIAEEHLSEAGFEMESGKRADMR